MANGSSCSPQRCLYALFYTGRPKLSLGVTVNNLGRPVSQVFLQIIEVNLDIYTLIFDNVIFVQYCDYTVTLRYIRVI